MKSNHPILDALKWATLGAIAAAVLILSYQSLSSGTELNDAASDAEARLGHR